MISPCDSIHESLLPNHHPITNSANAHECRCTFRLRGVILYQTRTSAPVTYKVPSISLEKQSSVPIRSPQPEQIFRTIKKAPVIPRFSVFHWLANFFLAIFNRIGTAKLKYTIANQDPCNILDQ